MMESLEFPSLWGVEEEEEEDGIFGNDFLPKDQLVLDHLLEDLTPDLLFKPTDDSAVDVGSALGDFDWLDLKMDFSHLDCAEDHENALNDPLVMEKDHGTDLAFSQMEKQSKVRTAVNLLSYTPPSSPEGQVPDVSRPINTVRDHNMFSSDSCTPPESPRQASSSSNDCILVATSILIPADILQDILDKSESHLPVQQAAAHEVAPEPVVDVTRQEDVRPVTRSHPYSRPNRKASSILKSKVKLADSDSSSSGTPSVKKDRKRVQNKDAATRYRFKKRIEAESLEDQEGVLKEQNQELCRKVKQLSSEITYLKGLMRDMFRARGILK